MFTITYQRTNQGRLSDQVETEIKQELLRDKALVEDKELPIHDYNYAALADRLKKKDIHVSTTTITKRAKVLGCYRPRKKKAVHDREVLTASIGDLIQHDASLHKWSPYADEKWTLITSLDDYSRMLLYADFVEVENTWAHIQAAQSVMQNYGLPLRYYVDNLRVFRFVQKRDSFWRNHHLETDEVDPQWKQVLRQLNVEVVYALSPQAKGKVERQHQYWQKRLPGYFVAESVRNIAEANEHLDRLRLHHNANETNRELEMTPDTAWLRATRAGRNVLRPFKRDPWWPYVWSLRTQVKVGLDGTVPVGTQRLKTSLAPRAKVTRCEHPDGSYTFLAKPPGEAGKPVVLLRYESTPSR